jgi:hypothetical protein
MDGYRSVRNDAGVAVRQSRAAKIRAISGAAAGTALRGYLKCGPGGRCLVGATGAEILAETKIKGPPEMCVVPRRNSSRIWRLGASGQPHQIPVQALYMLCSYQRRAARFFCLNDLSQRAKRVPVFFVAIMVRSPCDMSVALFDAR